MKSDTKPVATDDLIARLIADANAETVYSYPVTTALLREAAAALSAARDYHAGYDALVVEYERLQADLARARAALEDVIRCENAWDATIIARRALAAIAARSGESP